MPSLFSSFPLLWLGGIVGPLSFLVAGIGLIAYDLTRIYQASKQEKQPTWYERPFLWFGGTGIAIGFVARADSMIVSLPGLWPGIAFFLGLVGIGLLTLFCGLLTLRLSANQKRHLPDLPIRRGVIHPNAHLSERIHC